MGKGTWTPCMSAYLIVKMHQVWAEDKTGFKEDQFSVPVALDSCEGFKPATNAAQLLCLGLKSAFRPNSYYYSVTLRDILKRNCSWFGLQLTFSKGHGGGQTDRRTLRLGRAHPGRCRRLRGGMPRDRGSFKRDSFTGNTVPNRWGKQRVLLSFQGN